MNGISGIYRKTSKQEVIVVGRCSRRKLTVRPAYDFHRLSGHVTTWPQNFNQQGPSENRLLLVDLELRREIRIVRVA